MQTPTLYDLVPYPSGAFTATHPMYLQLLGRISGIDAPDINTCRYLEIGCSDGGNLIPMAMALPNAEFIGLDLSQVQIESGRAAMAELGIQNITLIHGDIVDYKTLLDGKFDYIMSHGVFSWIPKSAQKATLEICRDYMQPNGVAYISYNVLPGWHLFRITRDFINFHVRNLTDPAEKIQAARALLNSFEFSSEPATMNAHQMALRQASELLANQTDTYMFHDFMEDINDPFYFSDFTALASEFDLQYLANAYGSGVVWQQSEDSSRDAFLAENSKSVIDHEQYLDFFSSNAFRQTLLCHANIDIRRELDTDVVTADLGFASSIAPETVPENGLNNAERIEYIHRSGTSITSAHPLTKAAFAVLKENWPHAVKFERLAAESYALLQEPADAQDPDDIEILKRNLVRGFAHSTNLVELHYWELPLAKQLGEGLPQTTALVQKQLQAGSLQIVNMRHEIIVFDQVDNLVLQQLALLDTRQQLAEYFFAKVQAGEITETVDGEPYAGSAAMIKQKIEIEIDQRLQRYYENSLLVADEL